MQKVIEKKELVHWLKNLAKEYEIIAPVKKNPTRFEILKNFEEIYLDKITLIPAKNLFLPEDEIIFEYENKKIKERKRNTKKRIIFGLRKCDLNAINIIDKLMFDPMYREKRENSLLIGFHCENPDKYCFCNSMDLSEYYDVFIYPHKGKYYLSIGSKNGEKIVKNFKKAEKEIIKEIKNYKEIYNKNIEEDYQNKAWETDVEKCLSCAACTVYCPTCSCYDIKDIPEINFNKGKRIRKQTSCHLKSFTEVAGGKIYRDTRSSRFKHFVYHKISYYKKRFGKYMCVGCGRCLRACPAKIDWTKTINTIKGQEKLK